MSDDAVLNVGVVT